MELMPIDRAEALRYLGVRGEPPPETQRALTRCEKLLRETARPRTLWRLFPLAPDGSFSGAAFRPGGRDVRAHLSRCRRVVAMAATLGMEAELLLRRAQSRSMGDAVLLDALGSAAVEQVCDRLCAALAERFAPARLTARFSPGYGDWALSEQGALFRLLNVTKELGVSLTESGLMVPQKSVTALIGISDGETDEAPRGGCASCAMGRDCPYRKEGTGCGKP